MDKPQSDFSPVKTMMMQRMAFFALLRSLEMGLFDSLEQAGGLSAGEAARAHGVDEARLEALLEVLVASGVLERRGDAYANTPMASEYLVRASPFFQGKSLRLHVGFNDAVEKDFMGLLRGDVRMREEVDDGWGGGDTMEGTAQDARDGTLQDTVRFASELPGFAGLRTMADIGGNHGEFSMGLLDLNPDLSGEILDLPGVVPGIAERIDARGYAGRLKATAHDLRARAMPPGAYDLVLASHVLYAFIDTIPERLADILAALRPGGWFVAQHLDPEGNASPRHSTVVEFVTRMAGYKTHHIHGQWLAGLLADAGFAETRTAKAGPSGLLVAARKA
ncbi:methyltransferase family protein [Desulfocurvus sp. DL9XJH121]